MSNLSGVANPATDDLLREQALGVLRDALRREQNWVRVHAAEALIAVGEGATAREAYLREFPAIETSPQRVGAWRVCAYTATSAAERATLAGKMEAAFLAGGADRLQAIESLCKLRVPVAGAALERVEAMSRGLETERPLACWALHVAGDGAAMGRLLDMLMRDDPGLRLRVAYALRWIQPTDPVVLEKLAGAAERGSTDTLSHAFVLGAALALRCRKDDASWIAQANEIIATGATPTRYELCQALIQRGAEGDPRALLPLFAHTDGDVRIGAAWRVVELLRRG